MGFQTWLAVFKIDEVPPERCPSQPQNVDHQPSTPDLSLFHYLNPIFVLLAFVGHSLVFQGVQRHTAYEYPSHYCKRKVGNGSAVCDGLLPDNGDCGAWQS
jgi:hypothetical protein